MTSKWMVRAAGLLAVGLLAAACGEDELSACGSDADCKGDRICVETMCVDPGGGGPADGGAAADGGSGSGGSSTAEPVDDDALEEACMMDCIARQDAACENDAFSLDQCRAQCLVVDEQNHGYCLEELRARYACHAEGGYSCISGHPQPRSTCIEEQTEYSACAVDIPCWRFCDATGDGCADNRDACVDTCLGEMDTLQASYCHGDYGLVLNCWANQAEDLACDGERPEVGTCSDWVARTADCLGRRGEDCEGYCWAAESLGCGEGCLEDCQAKSEDAACGYYYDRMVDCAASVTRDLNLTCQEGAPQVTAPCDSERMQWESCVES